MVPIVCYLFPILKKDIRFPSVLAGENNCAEGTPQQHTHVQKHIRPTSISLKPADDKFGLGDVFLGGLGRGHQGCALVVVVEVGVSDLRRLAVRFFEIVHL